MPTNDYCAFSIADHFVAPLLCQRDISEMRNTEPVPHFFSICLCIHAAHFGTTCETSIFLIKRKEYSHRSFMFLMAMPIEYFLI